MDKGGISEEMHEYVFEVCFNPQLSTNNSLHFLDQCLFNLSQNFLFGDDLDVSMQPSHFAGAMDIRRLARFWMEHGAAIRTHGSTQRDRVVFVSNHKVSYARFFPALVRALDALPS